MASANSSFLSRLCFRFFFCFFCLYIFLNPNGGMPVLDALYEFYIQPLHLFIPWLAKNVLTLEKPITVFTNGSGDTTYDYVTLLFIFVSSCIIAFTWTLLNKNQERDSTLNTWLTVLLRLFLGFSMISYGYAKLFKMQFSFPSLADLLQPIGESSPMGLAWNFMGYSAGYNYFTGSLELLAGLLLFWRRTSVMGTVLTLLVMTNVAAMNYCYDIPVKLFSSTTVVMCLFLLAPHTKRFVQFFWKNGPAEGIIDYKIQMKKRWLLLSTKIVFKYLQMAFVVLFGAYQMLEAQSMYGDKAPKPPLYGIYEVEQFVRNNDTIAPLKTDTTRWDKFIIAWQGNAAIQTMNGKNSFVICTADTVKKELSLNQYNDTINKYTLKYEQDSKDHFVFSGVFQSDTLKVTTKRFDEKNFILVSRGFHWINEYPFNR